MNQPNLSVMTPRTTTATAESLDLMAIFKRYTWLLIAGAVLGAGASWGGYEYESRYDARYTAHIPFQILAPQPPIGSGEQNSIIQFTSEDTAQVIHRQEVYFQGENFLKEIMASEEFHPVDPVTGKPGESAWLAEHKTDVMYYIKRDLTVVPRINAGTFEVTMTAKKPEEAYNLVRAAVKVYLQRLQKDSNTRRTAFLRNLSDAVKQAQDNFTIKSDALLDYGKRQGIDVLKSRFDIERDMLKTLNDDYTRADAAASNAEQQYEAVKKQKADGKPIQLTSDLLQSIENDYTIKWLMNQRLSWEQELAAAEAELIRATGSTSGTARMDQQIHIQTIHARMDKIDAQVSDMRTKLTDEARERMVKLFEDEAVNKRFLSNYIGDITNKKKDIVTGIGQQLLVWQQKVDDLKEQGDLVAKIRSQLGLAQANTATDDTRVAQMDDPVIPDQPSWPKWYMFLFPGTLAGLGLAALMSYLLVLTDTRVRTLRDISKTLQMPVLGFVPDESDDRMLTGEVETAILSAPASLVAESFRQIRSQILAQTAHNPVNTVLVSSIGPGGGASTVASNLAASMALNDLRVLLVDANFYRPSLDRVFKYVPKEGFTDAVADISTADACSAPHPTLPRLHVMGVGTALAGASSEIFESRNFRELLDHLKSKYDLIIFDGAPLNLVSDSLALAARVDGLIPVIRGGAVSRGAVARVRDQIRSVHGNLMGFVLNAAQTSTTGYFKENYRSFYKYAGKANRGVKKP